MTQQVEGEPAGTSLPLPAPGEAEAVYLDDGAPVFVVRHLGGELSVMSATNPHLKASPQFWP